MSATKRHASKHNIIIPLYGGLRTEGAALANHDLKQGSSRQKGVFFADTVQHCAHQFLGGDQGMFFCVCALVMLGA